MRFQKSRYIPKDAIEVRHPQNLGVAYVYRIPSRGSYGVIAYGGQRNSSDFHYSMKTIEMAHDKIEAWFSGLTAHVVAVAQRRVQSFQPHTFNVGDVVYNSWGYDQTNVDWYRVAKTSAHYVWLQPISGHCEETGFMSGNSEPQIKTEGSNPAEWGFSDKEKPAEKHRANGAGISMKYGSATKWTPGMRVYQSWYA
jgi:hypothetical protein